MKSEQTERGRQHGRVTGATSSRTRRFRARYSTASVDLTNALLSTDRPSLWLKLLRLGMKGRVFDWLRMLCDKMRYNAHHNGQNSDLFQSLIGILIGDNASPDLWNIYLSDFRTSPNYDNPILSALVIVHLEQAEDLLLLSYSAGGLQKKMVEFEAWCKVNPMLINVIKTIIFLLGYSPRVKPVLCFGSKAIAVKDAENYLGFDFIAGRGHPTYKTKAGHARSGASAVLQVESMCCTLPPREGKILYMGQVDPHLIYAGQRRLFLPGCDRHIAFGIRRGL